MLATRLSGPGAFFVSGRSPEAKLTEEGGYELRSVIAIGICTLAFGLTIPASGRCSNIIADRWLAPPEVEAAGIRADDRGKPAYDEVLSRLQYPFQLASQPNLKQSVFVFGGRTNSGNLGSTFVFGAGAPEQKFYDNYILGAAYQRDFFQFNSGILVGAEVGFADRFGHYTICCDSIVYSDSVVHSAELWGGISFRHQGIALFDAVQISPGFVFGLSAISNPIGQEAEHQIVHQGSAGVLFYLGFDLAFALTHSPDTELVFRIQHRSGAYGTLGAMKEGNNANVVGIRHRF
jgi:hypothetical protein